MAEPDFGPYVSTLPYHLQHPEISPHAHLVAKSRERAETVNTRKAIYLDTRFWIKLRDATNGTPQEADDTRLYAALTIAVREGKAICPFATDIFSELTHIGDDTRRRAAARLVDELSLGVTLRTEQERIGVEVEDFIKRKGREPATTRVRDLMWACPGFAYGMAVPTNPHYNPATNRALQKAFIDHLYTLSYEEQDTLLGKRPGNDWGAKSLAKNLNRMNKEHAASVRSVEQVTKVEFRGVLDSSMDTIARVIQEMAEAHFNRPASRDDTREAKSNAPKFASLLAQLFEQGRIGDFVPSIVVRASLAGGIRWDKARQYHENDFFDHSHAVAALPYFDIFATEKSLAHLVSNDLKLDKRYGAKVVKTSRELLDLLK